MVLGRRRASENKRDSHTSYSSSATCDDTFQGTAFEIMEEQDDLLSRSKMADTHPLEVERLMRRESSLEGGISEWEAAASLAKAIMGAGSFALPWAFGNMGYVAGPIFMTILMVLAVYSLKLLVKCSRTSAGYSYVDVARSTFGPAGARLCYVASCSASIGVCGSYLVFIAANLQSLVDVFDVSQNAWILAVLPIAVALSSVRDMKRFAFVSLLGDISVVLGMAVVLIYGFIYESHAFGHGCVAMGRVEAMPLAFGTIGYLFLVHFQLAVLSKY